MKSVLGAVSLALACASGVDAHPLRGGIGAELAKDCSREGLKKKQRKWCRETCKYCETLEDPNPKRCANLNCTSSESAPLAHSEDSFGESGGGEFNFDDDVGVDGHKDVAQV
mmetsp:Transcript_51575/g.109701  ORF Transcript_51575/g.109701 Transcript_51575/m.109701 type:complete len:112 (-) Transcript_51575:231-566(-)|eukprot:CAMPEP_0172533358 /NCGR_PEP_ID=MMETSP1067-20121228/6090_1 /TAXON_ID=265564 ORGANISM="Thalassiosira punctigera, Strain Tpunct2005C2" /NCGR_SAMPLE_ID=MMETSP1067 /ASSEMBLY_ACC=CAM_ASM_000444 /LENGTH=111 /DNA_ID=CAMNT_0013317989 /DNA_START=244 /DNA_END=579 /DNA_ORIENTATION=-